MMRIPPEHQLSYNLHPMFVYVEDVEQIAAAGRARGFSLRFRDADYIYDSVDEVVRERRGETLEPFYMELSKNRVGFIHIEWSTIWTYVSSRAFDENEDEFLSLHTLVRSTLSKRVGPIRSIAHSHYSTLPAAVAFGTMIGAMATDEFTRPLQALLWIAVTIAALFWAVGRFAGAGFMVVRKSERAGSLKAHGIRLGEQILLLVIGAVIALVIQWVMEHW